MSFLPELGLGGDPENGPALSANPYRKRALRNAWTLGERAGYRGADLRECPYGFGPHRIAWYEGHSQGLEARER